MSKADRSGGGSRPSKNNRQGGSQGVERPVFLEPGDLPGKTGLRPLSVRESSLRTEATMELEAGVRARPWYAVVNEWREWYHDYLSMHIEYEGPEGQTVRTRLENSYQPRYGKRYYAKLKDFERGVSRYWGDVTTAMLTFTASTENAKGLPRCPADHMRDVADGWRTARKQLHQVLDGLTWEYARVWEPHKSGYGHLHVAVFIETDDTTTSIEEERFRPVIDSYLNRVSSAGSEAHTLDKVVSVNDDVENIGSYISEYIGVFGDDPLERPLKEQMFYAVAWATQTRRLDFSNGAQEIISGEQFRRETGLRPKDRGEVGTTTNTTTSGAGGDESGESGRSWRVDSICTVRGSEPEYHGPTTGGVDVSVVEGRPGMDPPKVVE